MAKLKDLNPGSPSAIRNHCTCPVVDNGHGNGSGYTDENGNPLFWYNENCPLHKEEYLKTIEKIKKDI